MDIHTISASTVVVADDAAIIEQYLDIVAPIKETMEVHHGQQRYRFYMFINGEKTANFSSRHKAAEERPDLVYCGSLTKREGKII